MSDFAWWYYTLGFTCSLYFQWPWHYFKVTAVSDSFNRKFYVPIRLSWNFVGLVSPESRSWIYCYFRLSRVFKGANWRVSWFAKFRGHCSSDIFRTLHDYVLVWGLPIHTEFDDFDLVSRSQVCQNHKLQIVFLILVHCSLNVVWCLHTLKDQAHCALCDLRDN